MANIKISELTPKGVNLASTDLLEISEYNGSGYTTKSITGQEIIDAAGSTNPTDTYYPINDNGSFADGKLREDSNATSVFNSYDFTISRIANPSKVNLFSDLQNDAGSVESNQGIQWGYNNANEGWGPGTWIDCSIVNTSTFTGAFGSTLLFKAQKSFEFSPSFVDTQQVALAIKPWNFMSNTGGISIYGGDDTSSENTYLNVHGDSSFPPFYKSTYSVAKFSGGMSGVVFPNVTTSSQSMMMAENGMVLYNSTTNKLQVYANGTWVNLH